MTALPHPPLTCLKKHRLKCWFFGFLFIAIPLTTLYTYHHYATLTPPESHPNYYRLLGDAFASGKTHLNVNPRPEIFALSNAYDTRKNSRYRLHDASLYEGKYYLYFGPVPALIPWLPVYYLTGIRLTDAYLTFFFAITGTLGLTWLLFSIAVRQKMVIGLGFTFALLALCYGTWLPFLVRVPSFYQVAISGAYCFSVLGLVCLWHSFWLNRRQGILILQALASLCFGLAVGCRIIHLSNIIFLLAACLLLFLLHSKRLDWKQITCLFAPWLVCLIGLEIYNYVRFDSFFETGWRYQLTIYDPQHLNFPVLHFNHAFNNAFFYLFKLLEWKDDYIFPFFHVRHVVVTAMPWDPTLIVKAHEPVYGMLTNTPFSLWFLALPFFLLARRLLLPHVKILCWAIALFAGSIFGFHLLFFYPTARYMVDFAPWFMFLASIAYLQWLTVAKSHNLYPLLLVLGGGMALYSAFTGIAVGYCSYHYCLH